MSAVPSAAQEEFAQRIRVFANAELAPGVQQRERQHRITHDIIRALAKQGLLGVNLPTSLGGIGMGAVAYAMAVREVGRVDSSVAVTMAVTNMVGEVVNRFGTPAQREKYIPPLTDGTYFAGAFALSEANAGSDAASLNTRAVLVDDAWIINGEKIWITSGDAAGVMILWARTGGPRADGISCFLVEGNTPGVSCGKPEEKLGQRASHTVPVALQDVRLPRDALLGELGGGFRIAMAALDGGRIGIAALATGMAAAALDLALGYVASRGVDVTLDTMPAARKCADMVVALDAGWLLTLRAAWLKERGRPFTREAAMAKVFASESANVTVRDALEVLGETELLELSGAARLVRDCRVTQIYEGTSEVQRLVISREVLKA